MMDLIPPDVRNYIVSHNDRYLYANNDRYHGDDVYDLTQMYGTFAIEFRIEKRIESEGILNGVLVCLFSRFPNDYITEKQWGCDDSSIGLERV